MPVVVKIPGKVKPGGAKGHYYKWSFKVYRPNKLIDMNHERVGAEVQGELFKRRRGEIPDAERVSILQEKLYQKAKQEREYYKRKSQRKCRLYGHNAFEGLITKFGLIDPSKYVYSSAHL